MTEPAMQHGPLTLTPAVSARDHALGPASAAVTLVEFGDYECPHCARAYFVLRSVRERLGNALRFVFRSFPLSELHPHAAAAALAAEAAAGQGKFWPMHDLLFQQRERLHRASLLACAAWLKLDIPAFESALASDRVLERVRADLVSGEDSGVNGTPTFFANGRALESAWSDEDQFVSELRDVARRNRPKLTHRR